MSSQNIALKDSSKESFIQLYGTDSLCFDKNDFMKVSKYIYI